MITVACVWVKANVPYGVEYVTRLKAMVGRHLHRAHRFVCLTDRPEQVPEGIDPIAIPNLSPLPGWWSKLELFNPSRGMSGRVLYLDLDSLVVGSLEPVVDFPAPFAIVPDTGSAFKPREPFRVVKRFNSSVMVFDAGECSDLFTSWSPAIASDLWGDQCLIGERYPNLATMPAEWFPRISELGDAAPSPVAKVVLCKKPKNEVAAARLPWVADVWRAA